MASTFSSSGPVQLIAPNHLTKPETMLYCFSDLPNRKTSMQKDILKTLVPPSRHYVPYTPHTKPVDLPLTNAPQVWNIKAFPAAYRREANVYIGRGGPWGNPFVIGVDGDRTQVIGKHADWLADRIDKEPELFVRIQQELKGRHLVCHCAPLSCHGDLLLQLANEQSETGK